MFQFIVKVLQGVEVRALCRPDKFYAKLAKPYLYSSLLLSTSHSETAKSLSLTVVKRLDANHCLISSSIKISLIGIKEPRPNYENQSQTKSTQTCGQGYFRPHIAKKNSKE